MTVTREKTIYYLDQVILYLFFAYALTLGFSRAGLHIFSGVITLLVLLRYGLQPFPIRLTKTMKRAFALFWFAMTLSVIFADDFLPSLKMLLLQFYHFIPVLYAGFFLRKADVLRNWVRALVLSALSGGIVAIWQGLHGVPRATSFLGIMDFAGVTGLIIPVILVNAFEKKGAIWQTIFYLGTLLIAMLALLYNGTRAIWISSLIIFFIFLIIQGRKNRKVVAATFLLVCLTGSFLLTQPAFLNRAESISNTTTNSSNVKRLIMWQYGLDQFKLEPIVGVGLGNLKSYPFPDDMARLDPNVVHYGHVHNTNIQMMAETGTIGLLAYLGMIVFVFYNAFIIFREKSQEKGLILLLIMIEFMIHGMFDSLFQIATVATVWWLLLGIYLPARLNEGEKPNEF